MIHSFATAVADFLCDSGDLLLPESRVVVALSGGPDSCALLLALCEAVDNGLLPMKNRPAACGHFHHGLRADDADSEAAFCVKLCVSLGVPCVVELGDVPTKNQSPQASARRTRYAFLEDVAREFHADRLAVAHQADDVAETVLARVLRGTSVDGLVGIPKTRALSQALTLIRPILFARRIDVENYCRDKGIEFQYDPSNRNPRYTRSRLRAVLPDIAQSFNPKLVEALNRLAEHARADSEFLMKQAQIEARKYVRVDAGIDAVFLDYALAEVPAALRRRVLIRALRQALRLVRNQSEDEAHSELETAHAVAELERLLQTHAGIFDLPRGLRATTTPRGLCLTARTTAVPAPQSRTTNGIVPLAVPGETTLAPVGRSIVADWRAPRPPTERRTDLSFAEFGGTLAKSVFGGDVTLALRTVRIGDRIAPLGMGGKTKLLRDKMREARWPATARENVLVVVRGDTDTPLWVVGLGQAEETRVLETDLRVLFLNLAKLPPTTN